MEEKKKKLTSKQKLAVELLTNGQGLSYKEIAEQVGVDVRTIYRWRNESEFVHIQEEIERVNAQRWMATVDAARQAAFELCKKGNAKMVEFILKNEGYNPTTKVEADINTDLNIVIEE